MSEGLGRVTEKRAIRAIHSPNEVELWCKDYAATVILDPSTKVPVALRRRCKNRGCCRPERGMICVHVWDLRTGRYATEQVPER